MRPLSNVIWIWALATMTLLSIAAEREKRDWIARRQQPDFQDESLGAGTSAFDCQKLEEQRNKTMELFRRPLTREEYESRNFMWVRCRMKYGKAFDLGGLWFGPNGKWLREAVEPRILVEWHFRYYRGDWGDADLSFNTHLELNLVQTLEAFMRVASVRNQVNHRNLYLLNCPKMEHHEYYGWEAGKTYRAIYNVQLKSPW
ncbi:hypothetical protein CDD83_10986 [Cordyceps sp. RAO-2017]|nr:hypothetical protein CDD83_10986 [Cordyceps sp. RAO-2017]